MRFLFSALGRYLLWRTIASIGLVLAGVAATLLLLDLVEQMRVIGTRVSISVLDALWLTLLRLPQLLEATLPVVVLVGTMLALFQLNRRSELVAIRASGVSAWRFLAPTAATAALVGLFGAMALNPAGAALFERYESERDRYIGQYGDAPSSEVWLRQGDEQSQIVITAKAADPRRSALSEPVFLFFDVAPDGALSFARRLSAAQAELRGGFWVMSDVTEAAPGAAPTQIEALSIPTPLETNSLIDRFVSPTTLSFWALPGFIAEARAAGLTPTQYELRWLSLATLPALLAAMAALGAAFSLRLQRLGGVAAWSMLGLAAGVAVFFGMRFSAAFASADIIPPALAVWAPPISGFFAAMALIAYLEDG